MEFLPTEQVTAFLSRMFKGEDESEECEGCKSTSERDEISQPSKVPVLSRLGSGNLIQNLGIMLVIALAIVLFLLILVLMKYLGRRYERVSELYKNLRNKVYYNTLIRYVIQSTLKIQIASCTTIGMITWSTFKETSQGILAIFLMTLFTICPLLFALVLYRNNDNLHKQAMRAKIGTMYPGVWLEEDENNRFQLSLIIVFLVRRSIFVALTFSLYDYPSL